jgi:hypothetical protein
MILSNYQIKESNLIFTDIIKNLFENRLHKTMKVDKSDFLIEAPMIINKMNSQKSQNSNTEYKNEIDDQPLVISSLKSVSNLSKTKMIQKIRYSKQFYK